MLLSSIDGLLPHEEVIPKNLNRMMRWLVKTGRFMQPILVDGDSKVILDGHHRWNAAKALLSLIHISEPTRRTPI